MSQASGSAPGGSPGGSHQGAASSVPATSEPAQPGVSASAAPSQSQIPSQSQGRSFMTRTQGTPGPASFRGSLGGVTPRSVVRMRGDLGNTSLLPRSQTQAPSFTADESERGLEEDEEEAGQSLVWGTNINVTTIQRRLRRFLKHFQEECASEPKYVALLRQLNEDNASALNIDCRNLHGFDATLYGHLVAYPSEVTTLLDNEARQLAAEIASRPQEPEAFEHILTKPHNLVETKVIRDLNPSDINKLISVSGMITRTSNVIPDLRVAFFKCQQCQHEEWRHNDRGRIEEPTRCPSCNTSWSMQMVHNRSAFHNKQLVKMQENPNAIPEGETPHSVTMLCFDEMVDAAKPGDRVTVTGIYKAVPLRVNPRLRVLKSVYKTHIDIMHVRREENATSFTVAQQSAVQPVEPAAAAAAAAASESQPVGEDLTREQQEARELELEALGAEPQIYDMLVASLAPSIWQLEDVKKGILCQLFGGTPKEFSGGKVRGELNVLLCGDPGVSKSQLLTYVNKLAPRGLYTSGRSSSAVGLTAYVTKDPETREMVLESGALVLSDRGICCIDEFDKMAESTRSMLHEVMEQQTVSVAKAGIIAQLNARTSVLASANPVGSRYNPRLSVVENIHLPPSLLSRFDLIYLLLDKPSESSDRQLARHLVSLYYEHRPAPAQAMIPIHKLKDYIAYARKTCQPEITDEAATTLVERYLDMRAAGKSRKVITATPRQLESMVRIAEALARMRLAKAVESGDVEEAVRLIKVAMQQSATDPATGAIDMDIIQTGLSSSDRLARQQLARELLALITNSSRGMTIEELQQKVAEQSSLPVDTHQIRDALPLLMEDLVHEGGRFRHKHALAAAE